jgi:hypothetical protein
LSDAPGLVPAPSLSERYTKPEAVTTAPASLADAAERASWAKVSGVASKARERAATRKAVVMKGLSK